MAADNIQTFVRSKIDELISNDEQKFVDSLITIIRDHLPIIYRHNQHLHDNIRSAIELVLDQSSGNTQEHVDIKISDETIRDVEEIIKEIG